MASKLSAPHFTNETAALAFVEAWLWPNGPVCPFCGETNRVGRMNGKTTRPGLCKCYACQKPFTVKMGTVFQATYTLPSALAPSHLRHVFVQERHHIRQLQRTLAQRRHEDRFPHGPSDRAGEGGRCW